MSEDVSVGEWLVAGVVALYHLVGHLGELLVVAQQRIDLKAVVFNLMQVLFHQQLTDVGSQLVVVVQLQAGKVRALGIVLQVLHYFRKVGLGLQHGHQCLLEPVFGAESGLVGSS